MRRFEIDIEVTYGGGIYDGDEYHDIVYRESPKGDWVKYDETQLELVRLQSRIHRMQRRIDSLEGRA